MATPTMNFSAPKITGGKFVPTNYGALSTLIVVFFFWGFIAAGNSVFIPFCKHYFHLDQFQSQLVDFAFYLAYYIGALGLFAYGAFGGNDLVAKWGYKKSIVYGLLFSALGRRCHDHCCKCKHFYRNAGRAFYCGTGIFFAANCGTTFRHFTWVILLQEQAV